MANSPGYSLPLLPLQAERGVTALAGEVRTLSDQPLEGVTLRIASQTARTDRTGRFLLTSLSPGHHVLLIDGRSGSRRGRMYGMFEVGIDVKTGRTNVLPFTIWMPELDMTNVVFIPSPTQKEVVVTNPNIPGLQLLLPPGTVIRDRDGRVVTHLNITPIPVDRPPFPLPFGAEFPMYFTVQPGGAYIGPHGARIIYPNITNEPPGTRINFWYYDPQEKDWYIYGKGTVTTDGKQVVPDKGIVIYRLTGASIRPFDSGPPSGDDNDDDGDPVNLATGLFVLKKTDLFLPDVLPIAMTRTHRQGGLLQGVRPFGIGSSHLYEMFLFPDVEFQEADLTLPDGGRVHYIRVSPGEGITNAVFEHTATPSVFFKSRIQRGKEGWELTLRNGTVYVFEGIIPILQSIRDRYGNRISVVREHDEHGKVTRVISPNGKWLELTLDADIPSKVTQVKDNTGRVVTYEYDEKGRLFKITDPMNGKTEYTYDDNLLKTIKDSRGIVYLTNEYPPFTSDALPVLKQTLADGSIYRFDYTRDDGGNIIQTDVTDPRGHVRRVTFNPAGYILTDTRGLGTPDAQTTIYERQAGTNLLLSVTDPLGRKTAYTYDAMGNMESVTHLAETPDAVTTIFTYESKFNQLDSVTDPLGHTIRYGYDHKGSLTSITDHLGNSTILGYDLEGLPISITDPLGNVTRLTYDLGILSTITDPLGFTIKRYIDSAGRPIIVVDPRGQVTEYTYDNHNCLTQLTDPLGGVTKFDYDPNGNLDRVTDARGSVTIYTYEHMDRLESRTDPLKRSESYKYDEIGNVTQFTDRKKQVTIFSYDALNRLERIKYADDSTITYDYDARDRLRKVVDSISGTFTLDYDGFDQLTEVSSPQGTISHTYDAAGRRKTMTVPGQPLVTYIYDDCDRLTEITQGMSKVIIAYDAAGRPMSLTLPGDVIVEYGYNVASQLISIEYKRQGALLGNLIYEYDASGNRISMGGTLARTSVPGAISSLVYDAANQLRQREATSLTYDDNGNLTGDGVLSYVWDARNQLASINGPGISADFMYDAFGRRGRKTINGTSTEFLYDGFNIVQELTGGMPPVNLLASLGIDEYFIRTDANGSQILLFDALGSTLALLDPNGVQTEYTYEPFGATTMTGTISTNPFQYTGRENDTTGLYYHRARYYSPTLQRFISEDPIGFAGNDINLYAYVFSNPINFRDPLGLDADILETILDCLDVVREYRDEMDTSGRKDPIERVRKSAEELSKATLELSLCIQGFAGVGAGIGAGITNLPPYSAPPPIRNRREEMPEDLWKHIKEQRWKRKEAKRWRKQAWRQGPYR